MRRRTSGTGPEGLLLRRSRGSSGPGQPVPAEPAESGHGGVGDVGAAGELLSFSLRQRAAQWGRASVRGVAA